MDGAVTIPRAYQAHLAATVLSSTCQASSGR